MQKLLSIPKISRLLFESKWFMTDEAQLSLIADLSLVEKEAFFSDHIPSYKEETEEALTKLSVNLEANLTRNFTETDIPEQSIAYHRIWGPILADEDWYWYFSSKQYVRELQAADENPQIMSHFIHINSGGGEAWYLDQAWEATRNLKKPKVVLYEKMGCSAALYLGCDGDLCFALTQNDTIGSLGTMVSFWDIIPAFEKMGFKRIEEYATKSKRKNKKYNDLRKGKPEQYIKEELDPLQEQFETAVRTSRESIGKLPEDHPVVEGETFDGKNAIEVGLIDGIVSFEEAVNEAHRLGVEHLSKVSKQNQALSLI